MRKNLILDILQNANKPIKGGQLAEKVGVSRQIVVQDIAVMRAQGVGIIATPQGYLLQQTHQNQPQKILACCHTTIQEMADELETVVYYGGKVINVIVEHPVYGEIQGNIAAANLADVQAFMEKIQEQDAVPLAALTNGIHLHTVEAPDWEILEAIEHRLLEKGYIVTQDNDIDKS